MVSQFQSFSHGRQKRLADHECWYLMTCLGVVFGIHSFIHAVSRDGKVDSLLLKDTDRRGLVDHECPYLVKHEGVE